MIGPFGHHAGAAPSLPRLTCGRPAMHRGALVTPSDRLGGIHNPVVDAPAGYCELANEVLNAEDIPSVAFDDRTLSFSRHGSLASDASASSADANARGVNPLILLKHQSDHLSAGASSLSFSGGRTERLLTT